MEESGLRGGGGTRHRSPRHGVVHALSTLELFSWWAVVPSPELGALGLGVCQQITYNLEERKKEKREPKRGMGRGQGPHLEQDFGRTIRDTGERERGAHRDTERGAGQGSPTHDRVPGIPLSYRTKLHPATRGQARASYWLRSPSSPAPDKGQRQARSAVRWTPFSLNK